MRSTPKNNQQGKKDVPIPADTAQGWLRGFLTKIFPSLKAKAKPSILEKQPHDKQSGTQTRQHQPNKRNSESNGSRSERPSRKDRHPRTENDNSATQRISRREPRRDHTASPVIHAPDPDFPVITTTEELANVVAPFAHHEKIALDTEADSLHCYFDKLCLIQLSIPGQNILVDPLAEISLQPLFNALEGKTVIIHSADYDLRLLNRHGYTRPTVLFDTMIGARLLGATEFGLAALLHQHFGVTLAKASQKANWAIRPLPREMLEYAVGDTLNLIALAEIQEARLRELGRWSWFEQMCERQIRLSSIVKEKDPDTLWRISGYADLNPRAMAVLRALWSWRDQEAQSADRPAFHVLNNDGLIDAAHRFEKGEPVDPRHLRGNRRTRFFEAADQALQLPEEAWPRIIKKPRLRTTPEQDARFKELKKHRDAVAEKLQLDPTLIAPKGTLEQLSRNDTSAVETLLPWQKECLPPL
ncbi:MAG: HRDC domain-containing protein [Verrucomicrobiota bacterium]